MSELEAARAKHAVDEGTIDRLTRANAKKDKKISELKKTIVDLRADIKVANNIIAELMSSSKSSWETAVHLYDKLMEEEGSADVSSRHTMEAKFAKVIQDLRRVEKKRLAEVQRKEKEWSTNLAELMDSLSNKRSKLHEEKQKRRRLLQFQVDHHKSAIEEMQCSIVDLEIMLDKKNRLVNEVRLVCFRC